MGDVPTAMSVSEARERFSGQWLALEVISRDKNGKPEEVKVLQEGGTRAELREKIKGLPDVYVTFAGPVVPAGQGILYYLAL